MGNLVKEAFQVNGCTPLLSLSQCALHLSDGLVLALACAEATIGIRELWIEYLRTYQVDALAHDSIHYPGYCKLPHFGGAFLWDEGSWQAGLNRQVSALSLSCSTFVLRDSSHTQDCRVARGPMAGAGCLVTSQVLLIGIPLPWDSNIPVWFSGSLPAAATLFRLLNGATAASRPQLSMSQRPPRYWLYGYLHLGG